MIRLESWRFFLLAALAFVGVDALVSALRSTTIPRDEPLKALATGVLLAALFTYWHQRR